MKVQLAQIPSVDGIVAPNLTRVLEVIQAAQNDVDVIVFPETCLMGFPNEKQIKEVAESEDGFTLTCVQNAVRAKGISVVIGFAERCDDSYYNTTVLLSPDGICLKYRKTHLWATDIGVFKPGFELATGLWKGIRVGILICFDLEFPETARALAAQGAQILFITNANMDPYGFVHRSLIIARAIENQIFVVMANRCGDGSENLTFAGESAVISPLGNVLASLNRDQSCITCDIDINDVQKSRLNYQYLNQRRISLVGDYVNKSNNQSAHLIKK